MSIHAISEKIKKKRVKGAVTMTSRKDFEGMGLSAKVEVIQGLISLGLMHVAEELNDEVERVLGPCWDRSQRVEGYIRAGSNPGTVILGGVKVPVHVPRIRDRKKNCEVGLESYQRFKREDRALNEILLRRVLYGLSCRNYEMAVESVPGAIGLSSSTVSRRFMEATTAKLKAFKERDISGHDIVALFIDGKSFAEDEMVIVLGITMAGEKVLLDFVQTNTENELVCRQLLQGLIDRGLDVTEGVLAVVDGSKGLIAALKKALKGRVCIQRCQWHKRENILRYLAKSDQAYWRGRLASAYDKPTYKEAKAALASIGRELEEVNLSAARSLDEGLEETLTLHRLGLYGCLSISFKTTNCMESIMSLVEERCAKVDHWKNSGQKHRWLATSLLEIEPRLRKVKGRTHLPKLREALRKELKIEKQIGRREAA